MQISSNSRMRRWLKTRMLKILQGSQPNSRRKRSIRPQKSLKKKSKEKMELTKRCLATMAQKILKRKALSKNLTRMSTLIAVKKLILSKRKNQAKKLLELSSTKSKRSEKKRGR